MLDVGCSALRIEHRTFNIKHRTSKWRQIIATGQFSSASAHSPAMLGVANLGFTPPFVLLIGAAFAWYIASRAAVSALARDLPWPGRGAVGYWMPIALVALIA